MALMNGERPATIWLLTDLRYLGQRMPLAVADWLATVGWAVRLVVADEDAAIEIDAGLPPAGPWSELEPGDVVVARTRHPYALALLQIAEGLGARTLDSWSAISVVRNKVRCTVALARRGIPIPPTFLAIRPAELERVPADAYPLILKPVLGDNARGLRIVTEPAELAEVEWTDDLVLAQSYLEADGIDLKVYVAGTAIWAVRRPSPLVDAAADPVRAHVTTTLRRLADACRAEFGLHLFGLDVLERRDGSVVVDVNEFPNYTGVEDAPAEIGRVLSELATTRWPTPTGWSLVRA
jgi:ribosomal protein S6--L-glutamate ligase